MIDYFIIYQSLSHFVIDYYTLYSIDNLSDHIILLCILYCTIDKVINTENINTTLRWASENNEQMEYYKSCLNHRLQLFTIADTVTHCNTKCGCPHEHNITMLHNNIVTELIDSMNLHIEYKNHKQYKRKAVPGWNSELDGACKDSLLWRTI